MDRYNVVVTQRGPLFWFELYRNFAPLPARVRDGPYKSARTANAAGKVALREFLEAFDRERNIREGG